jgi:G protein beta subunit-like protein
MVLVVLLAHIPVVTPLRLNSFVDFRTVAYVCGTDCVKVPDTSEVAIRSIHVAPDGSQLVAANNKGLCFIWNLGPDDTSKIEDRTRLQAHKSYILKALYSPDANILATCSADKTVKLWRTTDYSLLKTLQGHLRWVWDCVFSADSAYLVTASSDNEAWLWELSAGETIRRYRGHHKAVTCVALSDN